MCPASDDPRADVVVDVSCKGASSQALDRHKAGIIAEPAPVRVSTVLVHFNNFHFCGKAIIHDRHPVHPFQSLFLPFLGDSNPIADLDRRPCSPALQHHYIRLLLRRAPCACRVLFGRSAESLYTRLDIARAYAGPLAYHEREGIRRMNCIQRRSSACTETAQ